MDWLFWVAMGLFVLAVLALIVLSFGKGSGIYLTVRRAIPLTILIALVAYGIVSIFDLYEYTSRTDANLKYVFYHPDTYTTIATFVTLLGFYQLLLDRNEKYMEIEKLKREEASVPLSEFQVITYAAHLKLVKKAETNLRKKLKKE